MWDATDPLWQGDFIFVHTASCPTSELCWEVLVSLSSTPSLQVFIQIDEITPQSSSGWTTSVLSDTPHRRCCSPLTVLCGPELNLLQLEDLCPSFHHLLSRSFLTWHLHQAFHNFKPSHLHIQTITSWFNPELWFSLFTPAECCLPPWGYDWASNYFSTVVQADL